MLVWPSTITAEGVAEAASHDDDVSIDATILRREAPTPRFPRSARAGGVGTGVGADGRPLEGAYGGRAFRTMQRRRGGRRGWRRPTVPVRSGVRSVSTHAAEDKLQRDAVVHAHDESTATVGDAAWTPVHANAPAVGARATAGVAAATDTTTGSTTQPTTAAAHTGSSEDDTQERAGQSHEAAIAELLAALGRPVATGADGTPIALLL